MLQFYCVCQGEGGYRMEKYISGIADKGIDFGIKLIIAVVILVVGVKVSKLMSKKFIRFRSVSHLEDGVKGFLAGCLKILLYSAVVITSAGVLGIPYASLVAVLGSFGIAIGLAAQGSLSNVAAGVLILINKPFKVGDTIEVNSFWGKVSEIGFFTTAITTLDNKVIFFPNSVLTNTDIINHTKNQLRMLDFQIGVSYNTDVEKVRNIVNDITLNDKSILKLPEPFVGISSFGDSAIILTIRFWCDYENYWKLHFSFKERLKKAFDEKGIEIPYNKLDVNIITSTKNGTSM